MTIRVYIPNILITTLHFFSDTVIQIVNVLFVALKCRLFRHHFWRMLEQRKFQFYFKHFSRSRTYIQNAIISIHNNPSVSLFTSYCKSNFRLESSNECLLSSPHWLLPFSLTVGPKKNYRQANNLRDENSAFSCFVFYKHV